MSGREVEGTVVEAMPHALYEVQLDSGQRVVGHIPGTMRARVPRIVPGDRVTLELSTYDLTRGRIIRRHR